MSEQPQDQPSPAQVARAEAAYARRKAVQKVTPTRDDVLAVLGRDALTVNRDGTWKIRVTSDKWGGEKNRSRFRAVNELMHPRRALQTEHSRSEAEVRNVARVRDRAGEVREIPVEAEAAAARKGFTPVRHYGRPSLTVIYHEDGTRTEVRR